MIYRLWGKEKKFLDNFNIVFVIMGEGGDPPNTAGISSSSKNLFFENDRDDNTKIYSYSYS